MNTPASALSLTPVEGPVFLRFAEVHSLDPVDGSRIKSQYEKELQAGVAGVGALGIWGCGQLLAAASFGTVALPRPGSVSLRIDVVVTVSHLRGRGLARSAVHATIQRKLEEHGDKLEHMSVIAVHPVIRAIVESLGFQDAAMNTSAPVLHLKLDDAGRTALHQATDRQLTRGLSDLRMDCARCLLKRRGPWCKARAA